MYPDVTKFWDEDRKRRPDVYWDCDLNYGSKEAISKWFKAMITCGGKLYDSFAMDSPTRTAWHKQSIFMRISLPEGFKEEFEGLSEIKLKEPPKVRLN
jgi:hypothetical protein